MVSGFNRILVTLVVAWSGMAIAGQIDRVVVVGADSLSDTGNLSLLSGGTQPPSTAYEPGTFSNGPIWIDELAADLGLTMNDTALITGPLGNGFVDNFAVAGSLTHSYNLGPSINVSNVADLVAVLSSAAPAGVPGATEQFGAYLTTGVDVNATTFVWAGSNDLLFSPFLNPLAVTDAQVRMDFATEAAASVAAIAAALDAAMVEDLVVLNLPDLGLTPFADFATPSDPVIGLTLQSLFSAAPDPSAAFSAYLSLISSEFNTALSQQLALAGLDDALFDLAASFADVVANPAAYGLTNIDDPCLQSVGPPSVVCNDPDQYLLWDDVHPTSAVHAVLAGQLLDVVAVPLPQPLVLILLGLAGLGLGRRRSVPSLSVRR